MLDAEVGRWIPESLSRRRQSAPRFSCHDDLDGKAKELKKRREEKRQCLRRYAGQPRRVAHGVERRDRSQLRIQFSTAARARRPRNGKWIK